MNHRLRTIVSAAGLAGCALWAASAAYLPNAAAQNKPAPPAVNAMNATTGSPMIEISKTCPNVRYVGRDATFEITVSNRGTGPANNVMLTDPVPTGVEFLTADGGGRHEGSNVVWSIGKLDANQSKTVKVTVRCNQIATIRNVATVTYCAEARAVCEFPVKGIPAILLECVDDPDPVEINGQLTYTITVTNQGSMAGTNIVIACTLPAEEEFVSAGGATTGTSSGKSVRFAPLPSLAPKATATYMVKVKGIKEGDVRFAVELTSDQLKTPVNETESTRVYE